MDGSGDGESIWQHFFPKLNKQLKTQNTQNYFHLFFKLKHFFLNKKQKAPSKMFCQMNSVFLRFTNWRLWSMQYFWDLKTKYGYAIIPMSPYILYLVIYLSLIRELAFLCKVQLLRFFPIWFLIDKIWDVGSGRLKLTLTGHIEQIRGQFHTNFSWYVKFHWLTMVWLNDHINRELTW